MEQWKPIPGFEGKYEVSNIGNVRSLTRKQKVYTDFHGHYVRTRQGKMMVCSDDKDGYKRIGLYDENAIRHTYHVHRLMLLAFVGKPEKADMQCNHKDGVKFNNTLDNLEWVTQSQNRQHSYDIGLESQVGSKNARSKLTEDIVVEARMRHAIGESDVQSLAKDYGIKYRSMWNVLTGRRWKHVPMPHKGED